MFKKISKQNLLLIGALVFFLLFIGTTVFELKFSQQTPQALIAPHIEMGEIALKVNNVDAMKNFYSQMLGMQVIEQNQQKVVLGYNKNPVLELDNSPQLRQPGANDPGLDQIAIVFNTRPGLAKVLQRVMKSNPGLYQGGTNRGAVGEAFYVIDPAGNVLELYYDTDPSTWPRTVKGNIEGTAAPIDINQYINQYANQNSDAGMKLGHLQIRIGDITQGRQFYLNTIGFYANPQLAGNGDSVSMSDGYYHHDLVINQAQGYDRDSIANYQGLQGFSFSVPNNSYLNKLKERLTTAHVIFTTNGNSIIFSDPWGIQITVSSLSNVWWENIL